jgi:hypothetical protein
MHRRARAVVAVDTRGDARVRELRIDGVLIPGAVPADPQVAGSTLVRPPDT